VSITGIIKYMAQIRDTDIIRTPEVAIDPRLFIPDGVIGIGVKSTEIDPDSPTPTADNASEAVDGGASAPGTGNGSNVDYEESTNNDVAVESGEVYKLPTPQTLTIVSQTIRIAPDGSSLVDVVIEVEDIPGVSNYDVRVTKA
jgi:hypothetical protein